MTHDPPQGSLKRLEALQGRRGGPPAHLAQQPPLKPSSLVVFQTVPYYALTSDFLSYSHYNNINMSKIVIHSKNTQAANKSIYLKHTYSCKLLLLVAENIVVSK